MYIYIYIERERERDIVWLCLVCVCYVPFAGPLTSGRGRAPPSGSPAGRPCRRRTWTPININILLHVL